MMVKTMRLTTAQNNDAHSPRLAGGQPFVEPTVIHFVPDGRAPGISSRPRLRAGRSRRPQPPGPGRLYFTVQP